MNKAMIGYACGYSAANGIDIWNRDGSRLGIAIFIIFVIGALINDMWDWDKKAPA